MGHLPKINVTSAGKKYFKVNGRRIYIESGVTRKQVLSIYKALQKTIKPKNNTNKTHNSAHAVVNINNGPSRRSRRPRKYVKFNSSQLIHCSARLQQVDQFRIRKTVVTKICSINYLMRLTGEQMLRN